jgi:hypothetical protein
MKLEIVVPEDLLGLDLLEGTHPFPQRTKSLTEPGSTGMTRHQSAHLVIEEIDLSSHSGLLAAILNVFRRKLKGIHSLDMSSGHPVSRGFRSERTLRGIIA